MPLANGLRLDRSQEKASKTVLAPPWREDIDRWREFLGNAASYFSHLWEVAAGTPAAAVAEEFFNLKGKWCNELG